MLYRMDWVGMFVRSGLSMCHILVSLHPASLLPAARDVAWAAWLVLLSGWGGWAVALGLCLSPTDL